MINKILIADDESSLRELLKDVLEVEIPNCKVITAENGEQAIDLFFHENDISLCILDVMMPIYDGYEVLETIRTHSQVPVIMLTAMGTVDNELNGFNKGVSDYVSKPFTLSILIARLKRLLEEEKKIYQFNGLRIDINGHTIWIEEKIILLTPREFSLLAELILNKGLVLTREQLVTKVWGYDYEGEVRTVDTHIKTLRKKLGSYGGYVSTIRGIGYKFQVDL